MCKIHKNEKKQRKILKNVIVSGKIGSTKIRTEFCNKEQERPGENPGFLKNYIKNSVL